MKHSIKRKKPHEPAPQPTQTAGLSRNRMAFLAGCLVLTCGATWAFMEFVVWNKLPAELVGKWEVVQGPPLYKDAEFEFLRSGKMIGHFNDNGMDRPMKADVHIDGEKLSITTWHPQTGKEHVSVQTIRSLTEREFVVADEQGGVLKMRRIR